MRFISSVVPLRSEGTSAWWYAFREDQLMILFNGKRAEIPCVPDLSDFKLNPVRTQYLGQLDGKPCYTAELDPGTTLPDGMVFLGLRELFGHLDDELFWLSSRAVQIKNWDKNHQYCSRCGARTVPVPDERAKMCPKCGLKNFPRISPAIITAVLKRDKILLARARRFPVKLYSVIAGFVEPGETLEECVERELIEEVGIGVKNIRYFGSQPWPFPDSLMIAFTAEHDRGEITIDNREIIEAGWFSATALPPIPGKISIARRLIDWFVRTRSERGEDG
jgi:NAD+ diphosphatase